MDPKPTLFITDDIKFNRVILTQAFEGDYQIIDAENGQLAREAY